jgi:uncharacterized membrane protein YccF (DUF307 family)
MATATTHYTDSAHEGPSSALLRGARSGLIAGMAMAMVMMGLGLFDQGFFAAPSSIWAFLAGPAAYHPRELDVSFVLGAMGHMMNSVILGILFAGLVVRIVRPAGARASTLTGIAFALAVMAVMWYAVLPLGAHGDLVKNSAAGWIWVAGHAAFGMVGGWLSWTWR